MKHHIQNVTKVITVIILIITLITIPSVYSKEVELADDAIEIETPQLLENSDTDAPELDEDNVAENENSDMQENSEQTNIERLSKTTAATESTPPTEETLPEIVVPAPNEKPKNVMHSGALSYEIPISVPPGRNGLAPNLSLNYSSSGKNSWVGVGWQLDMGAIQRSTKDGLDYNKDDFVFVKDGSQSELVSRSGVEDWGANYYGAKIEESFTKYYWDKGEGWVATLKDGTRYFYGRTINSRQDNPKGTFKWLLDRIEDTNGNYISISYEKMPPVGDKYEAPYLKEIRYTNHSGTNFSGTKAVKFFLENNDRFDKFADCKSYYEVWTSKRLDRIEVWATDVWNSSNSNTEQFVKTYELEYEDGSMTGVLSRLKSVQELSGSDSLPPTTILYREGGLGKFGAGQSNDFNTGRINDEGGFRTVYPANIDGDEYTDFIVYSYSKDEWNGGERTFDHKFTLYKSKGDGTFEFYKETGAPPTKVHWDDDIPTYTAAIQFVDINGDGRSDLITYEGYRIGAFNIYLNDTNGNFNYTRSISVENVDYIDWVTFAEVNGDGRADAIVFGRQLTNINQGYTKEITKILLSNGDGTFRADSNFVIGRNPLIRGGYPMFADVNGDGISDMIVYGDTFLSSIPNRVGVALGNGGYELSSFIWTKISDVTNSGSSTSVYSIIPANINGDDLTDILVRRKDGSVKTFLSNGDGSFGDGTLNGYTDIKNPIFGYGLAGSSAFRELSFVFDLNGDGLDDVIGGGSVYFANGDGDGKADLAGVIKNGMGGVYIIDYKPSSICEDTDIPLVMPVVLSIALNDGLHSLPVTKYVYTYKGGYYDKTERKFRGFREVTKNNPNNSVEISTFNVENEYKYGRMEAFLLKESDNTDSPYIQTTYQWDEEPPLSPEAKARFVKLLKKTNIIGPSGKSYSEIYHYYDDASLDLRFRHGSIKEIKQSFEDVGEDIITSYQYENYGNTENDWIWRKTQEIVRGTVTGRIRQTDFVYDDDTGNLLSETRWNDHGDNPVINYKYNNFGNLIEYQDANKNKTYTQYDAIINTYPIKITFPQVIGQTSPHTIEYLKYDFKFGTIKKRKDPNGNITEYDYDAFGRLKRIDYPDNGWTEVQYYDDIFPTCQVTNTLEDEDGNLISAYTYYDGFGRPIRSITKGENSSAIVKDTHYNEMGLIDLENGPYFGSRGLASAITPEELYTQTLPERLYFVETSYDFRDRPVVIRTPYNKNESDNIVTDYSVTSFDYYGYTTTITNPDGNQKEEIKDELGRVINVIEHADEGLLTTTYKYNSAGDMTKIIDAYGIGTTTFTMSSLGRKVGMTDPDMGTWSYSYDPNGNLILQTDANTSQTKFEYDELDRVKLKVHTPAAPAVATQTVTYRYDLAQNGIGQLYQIDNTDVITTFEAYDEMGRNTKVTKTIDGLPGLTTEYKYDYAGKINTITYPGYPDPIEDQYTVKYYYHPGSGLVSLVLGINDFKEYAAFYGYEPDGKMGYIKYPNDKLTIYTYYPNSKRLYGYITRDRADQPWNDQNEPVSYLQERTYKYYPSGDIAEINDIAGGVAYTYQYDKLHRLIGERSTDDQYNLLSAGKDCHFSRF